MAQAKACTQPGLHFFQQKFSVQFHGTMRAFKGKWQQNFLLSHLKETPKQYIEVYYGIFISALFGEIF